MANDNLDLKYALLQNTFCQMPESVFVKNRKLQYVAASDVFARSFGYSCAQDILGKTDRELMQDEQIAGKLEQVDQEIFASGKDRIDSREELYNKDAKIIYRSTSKYIVRDEQGCPVAILGRVQDITKEVIAEHRYNQEVQTLFEMSRNDCYAAVIDLNEWKIVEGRTNPVYGEHLSSASDPDIVLQKTLSCGAEKMDDARTFYSNFSFEYFSKLYRKGRDYFSFRYFHELWNGTNLWMKDTVKIRINPQNRHLMVLFAMQSIEEMKQKELALHRAAELDGLTGLLNRNHATTLMEKMLSGVGEAKIFSMFMIDIDNFKNVNDTYGHQTGDKVLIAIAEALRECFRSGDLICRMGGDEFAVLMPRTKEAFTTPERAQAVLERVKCKCIESTDVQVTVSIGICDYPKDGTTLEELYCSADKALYEAKKHGKNQFYIYNT